MSCAHFVADRAKESGDRKRYMALQFEQAVDGLTLKKYQDFKNSCSASEWKVFEPKVLDKLKDAWHRDQLKILMHRKEYDKAVVLLVRGRYPEYDWQDNDELRIAKRLEKRYPEKILNYYHAGLGNLNANAIRKEYARKAKVMAKVRHLMVDVMGDEPRWRKFASKIRQDNIRRPAFQQEFAKVLPGWQDLG